MVPSGYIIPDSYNSKILSRNTGSKYLGCQRFIVSGKPKNMVQELNSTSGVTILFVLIGRPSRKSQQIFYYYSQLTCKDPFPLRSLFSAQTVRLIDTVEPCITELCVRVCSIICKKIHA